MAPKTQAHDRHGISGVKQHDYLKIIHWNIEGNASQEFGHKVSHPQFQSIVQGYDIIALTETHASPDMHIDIPGFVSYQINRPKHAKARKHSGGIAVLVKQYIRSAITFLQSESKDIVWVKIAADKLGLSNNLYLGVVYISPKNSCYNSCMKETVYDTLEKEVSEYQKCGKVMLVGDFNSRTADKPDYICNDDDVFTPINDVYSADTPMRPRINTDQKLCDYGNQLLNLCKGNGLRIVNGRKIGDSLGKPTCFKWNGFSVVDYAIVDVDMFSLILSFKVLDILETWSDHCPISLTVNYGLQRNSQPHNSPRIKLPVKQKLGEREKEIFKIKLSSAAFQERISALSHTQCQEPEDIELALNELNKILYDAAEVRPGKNIKPRRDKDRRVRGKNKDKAWYDNDLVKMKNDIINLGKQVTVQPKNEFLRGKFFILKKSYKKALKIKKKSFKQQIVDQLIEMEDRNPRAYWELFQNLKECESQNIQSEYISDCEWLDHYKKLLSINTCSDEKIQRLRNEMECLKVDQTLENS